ncbi:MAG: hypothetical protein NTW96_25310 [Planctomycetia bacterium]|nr:hypothetical protein [Planctomycetia bacterium]
MIPKGVAIAMPQGDATGKVDVAKLERLPATDVSVECTRTVIFNGTMLRMDCEGSYWNPIRAEIAQDPIVNTFDGEVGKNLFDYRKSTGEILGAIDKEARNLQCRSPVFLVLALAYRPCDLDMGGLNLKKYTVSPNMDTIDDRTCVVLSPNPPSPHGEGRTLWLDPHRDLLVVRLQTAMRDKARVTTYDISYQKDPSHGWVPSEWKWIATGGGRRLFEQGAARMKGYSINTDIPRSEFQLDFPVGTYVTDFRSMKRYIARPAGEPRTVTKEELRRGAQYEDLLSTESGMARSEPTDSGGARLTLLLLSMVIIVTCVIALWVRQIRLRRQSV